MGTNAEERDGRAVRLAFRLYKSLLSPVLHAINPSRCLYLPTCSEYATIAVSRFGWVRGSWLALRQAGALPSLGQRRPRSRARARFARAPRAARPDSSGDVQKGANPSSAIQTDADKKAADQTGADHLP